MNRSLVRNLLALAALSGSALLHAGAVPTFTYYEFTGVCSDCTGTGVGILELENYTLGNSIASSFVDFSYSSNLLSFDIDTASAGLAISGSLPNSLPATNVLITIRDTATIFQSEGPNGWCTGQDCFKDEGPSYTWTATTAPSSTPEPATALLAAPFIAGLWFYRRRSTRTL